eukprot:GHVT01008287.1.p4 GENE.GHVT01008287.1~~GHVT01008287.1.p4  ORF type:complete len:122 (+),score=26.95 GHVT01008287.1:1299-1664(+)
MHRFGIFSDEWSKERKVVPALLAERCRPLGPSEGVNFCATAFAGRVAAVQSRRGSEEAAPQSKPMESPHQLASGPPETTRWRRRRADWRQPALANMNDATRGDAAGSKCSSAKAKYNPTST